MSDDKPFVIGHGRGAPAGATELTDPGALRRLLCRRCAHRVQALERAIAEYLRARDASEMSNEQAAVERFRRLLEMI